MTDSAPDNLPLQSGSLLVSMPNLLDPNFMHTVVLMAAVGEQGAMGFVLGDATGFVAGDLLSGRGGIEECELPIFSGGPVGRDQVHFLHRLPGRIPGGVELYPGLWLGGEFEALAACLREPEGLEGDLTLFVGYSGWGAGQLERELQEGSWVVLAPSPAWCFEYSGQPREQLWRQVLRSQGQGGEFLAQQPPDPNWN
ncbi:MAG: YqgE/AlgH family protein [Planctomycetota bacterium]